MAEKQLSKYDAAVQVIKRAISDLDVKDVVKMRKSINSIIRDVLKKRLTQQKNLVREIEDAIIYTYEYKGATPAQVVKQKHEDEKKAKAKK